MARKPSQQATGNKSKLRTVSEPSQVKRNIKRPSPNYLCLGICAGFYSFVGAIALGLALVLFVLLPFIKYTGSPEQTVFFLVMLFSGGIAMMITGEFVRAFINIAKDMREQKNLLQQLLERQQRDAS